MSTTCSAIAHKPARSHCAGTRVSTAKRQRRRITNQVCNDDAQKMPKWHDSQVQFTVLKLSAPGFTADRRLEPQNWSAQARARSCKCCRSIGLTRTQRAMQMTRRRLVFCSYFAGCSDITKSAVRLAEESGQRRQALTTLWSQSGVQSVV